MTRKGLVGRVVLALVPAVLVLGGLELGARVWHGRKGIKTWMYVQQLEGLNAPDPDVYWVNKSNLRIRPTPLNSDQEITTDEYGFRLPSSLVGRELQHASRRVLCMGGSTTFGYTILRDADTYPARLEKLLAEGTPAESVAVMNGGVNRLTSRDTLLRLRRFLPLLKPTDVVIYHGINDVAALFTPGFKEDYSHRPAPTFKKPSVLNRLAARCHLQHTLRARLPGRRGRSRADLTFQVRNSIKKLESPSQQRGAKVFRRNLLMCRDLCLHAGARLYVCTFAFDEGMLEKVDFAGDKLVALGLYNEVIRDLAGEPGLTVVEAAKPLGAVAGVFSDGCHFTPYGADLLAQAIAAAIRK